MSPGSDGFPTISTAPTSDFPATGASGDAGAEAADVTGILQQAAADRQSVSNAVTDAAACGSGLAADQQALTTAQQDRLTLATTAGNTATDALSGSTDLGQLLSTALSDSATADQDYATWIGDLQTSGCDPGTATEDDNYTAAQSASILATQDKQNFLAAWNPLAGGYGQPTWTESAI
ncbi:MAG TPA: hypothetical protein VG756_11135 [Pseudonocardiaceae bacterium]|nr:hypothetical protein [Pseudonocardiaceae bacterium]